MPGDHAVISGDVILEEILGRLERTTYREQDTGLIIRTEDFLLNKRKDTLLLKVVVVEERPQAFYIMVNKREGELTVRFDPTTDPEKTEGSEIALALICKTPSNVAMFGWSSIMPSSGGPKYWERSLQRFDYELPGRIWNGI